MRVGRERKDGAVSSGLEVLRPPEWLSSVPQSGRVSCCCCPALHARPRKIWTFFSPSHIFFSSHRQKKIGVHTVMPHVSPFGSEWARKPPLGNGRMKGSNHPRTLSGNHARDNVRRAVVVSNCYHVCMCACLHAVKTESCCVGGRRKNKLHFPCLGLPVVSRYKASVNLLRVPVRCLE